MEQQQQQQQQQRQQLKELYKEVMYACKDNFPISEGIQVHLCVFSWTSSESKLGFRVFGEEGNNEDNIINGGYDIISHLLLHWYE